MRKIKKHNKNVVIFILLFMPILQCMPKMNIAYGETAGILSEEDVKNIDSSKLSGLLNTNMNKYQFASDYIDSIAYANQSFSRKKILHLTLILK